MEITMNNVDYRAWSIKDKRYFRNVLPILKDTIITGKYAGHEFLPVDDPNYIFEQAIGISDRDGVRIFNGDIIEIDGDKGVVFWNYKDLWYEIVGDGWTDNVWNIQTIKVIGTVLQNGAPIYDPYDGLPDM